jgi:hypothetical protein
MINPYDIVFAHVVLPDSIAERKKVLLAMAAIVTPDHHAASSVTRQLGLIEKLETLQKELPLKFSNEAKGSTERDGQ